MVGAYAVQVTDCWVLCCGSMVATANVAAHAIVLDQCSLIRKVGVRGSMTIVGNYAFNLRSLLLHTMGCFIMFKFAQQMPLRTVCCGCRACAL